MNFGEASAVTPGEEGVWKAEVQQDWDIFGVSNGGYLMAIGARAMSGSSQDRRPVSLTAHFLRPLSAGPVEVAVDTLKTGRTFSTMRATIGAASDSVALLGSFADPGALDAEDLYVGARPPDLPPPDECPRAIPSPDGPLPPPIVGQFEERIHPEDAGPFQGRPSGVARMRGWFPAGRASMTCPHGPSPMTGSIPFRPRKPRSSVRAMVRRPVAQTPESFSIAK